MADQYLMLSWAGALAGADLLDGIRYTSVELQHLSSDWIARSATRYQGRDDGTTLLKVLAYVTRRIGNDTELLVIDHRDHPDAGTQVPAGTIEPGESPEAAAIRELAEETGLTNATLVDRIDVYEWEKPETGQWQRRHVYQFNAPVKTSDRWEYVVSAGRGDKGLKFICYWLPIHVAEARLCGDQGFSIRRAQLK